MTTTDVCGVEEADLPWRLSPTKEEQKVSTITEREPLYPCRKRRGVAGREMY